MANRKKDSYVLSIDQGTTSSRAIIFDSSFKIRSVHQKEFRQIFPKSGWVEHDALEILQTVIETSQSVARNKEILPSEIATIGITNQRETAVVWDKKSGKPIYNAIVWQDRRTGDLCKELRANGYDSLIREKTGLTIDPYFSATKIAWILDNVNGARERADNGELAFGTIDTWLLWNLCGGNPHLTDATNASRTMLFNITEGDWDDELLSIFRVPRSMLPKVHDSGHTFGITNFMGSKIPVCGVCGDQQSAAIGQACFKKGMVKSTYGTGCFMLLNTGNKPVFSKNRLLTTIASQLDGEKKYALEGSIFNAGTSVQWLRDGLKIIKNASESDLLAAQANENSSVFMVPAFTGLGAPYWNPNVRGAIFGLTRDSSDADLVTAALEAVCYQTYDLLEAMKADWQDKDSIKLRVDGGMSSNNWMMQRLADLLDMIIECPTIQETTALGAAWIAGSHFDVWPNQNEFYRSWLRSRHFTGNMCESIRNSKIATWHNHVNTLIKNPDYKS